MKDPSDIIVRKTQYGWILIDERGHLVEPLTRTHLVPYYRSEEAATKKAQQLLKERIK